MHVLRELSAPINVLIRVQLLTLAVEALHQDCLIGTEFSGHDSTGRRVMGLVTVRGLATVVEASGDRLWPVPDDWSLEQAATVPQAYSSAFYSLVVRGRVQPGETVLVHCGADVTCEAAIAVALSRGCRVLVTVNSTKRGDFLRRRFPQLDESSFADSRDPEYWRTIRDATGGRGVDLILNSLGCSDRLQSSVRLVVKHGRVIDVGNVEVGNNTQLGE